MPGMSEVVGRVTDNARLRIDSVTKTAVEDFRTKGVVDMVIGLGQRFGRNNRALIGR